MEQSVCEGVVRNCGSPWAVSSGESELAAVVRAATEGMGLQSILSDFDLCGHVAIKSDATAAFGMVHRLGLGTVRHLALGDLWVQHHVRSGKIRASTNVRVGESELCTNKVPWARTIAAPHKSLQFGSLSMEVRPILQTVTRCE